MTSRDFCFWLQGHLEINGSPQSLTPLQVEIIKAHLSMVFVHEIDPSFPPEQQAGLNAAHSTPPVLPELSLYPATGTVRPRC